MSYVLPRDVDERPISVIGGGTLGRRIAMMFSAGGSRVQLFSRSAGSREAARRFVDGQESFLRRLNTQPPPPPPAPAPGGPDHWYLLGTTVLDNWIPMVRVTASDGSPMLRRGKMARAVQGGPPVQVAARGQILEPSVSPYLIYDRSVPPAGAQLTRYVRRTRWLNGTTCLWIGRHSSPGKGPGWSGLQFDPTAPMGQGPDLVHP